MKVQDYLRSGKTLEELKAQYAINYRINEFLGVVNLNYSMIESPMHEPIVQECRCLILELGSWDVAGISLNKFFNYGENYVPVDFDWSSFKTYEKLDGSLILLWWHKYHGWQVSSRSVPDGSSLVDDSGLTFKSLVMNTLEDMGTTWEKLTFFLEPRYSYVFELMAPENQIVVQHKDRKLVLLAVRSTREPYYKESSIEGWEGYNPGWPTPVVQQYEGFSKEVVLQAVQERSPLEHEGFVLVDGSFNRIKVKSDAYCLMSHQRDGLGKSNKARLELILAGKDDDMLPLLPVFIQDKITDLKKKLVTQVEQVGAAYESIKDITSQKDFASEACKYRYSAILFAIRAKKVNSPLEWIRQANPKAILDWFNLDEQESSSSD